MKFEGRFQEGRVNGPGLITFPNGDHGRPRNEGIFEGTKIVRRENVTDTVKHARVCAAKAREIQKNLDSQDDYS